MATTISRAGWWSSRGRSASKSFSWPLHHERVDQDGRVHLRDERGVAHRFAPDRVRHKDKMARGNRSRSTSKGAGHHAGTASDGQPMTISADCSMPIALRCTIEKGRVTVETSSGMKLSSANDPMLARIDLAYAYNAHMAQGMTTDRAIVVMELRDTSFSPGRTFWSR